MPFLQSRYMYERAAQGNSENSRLRCLVVECIIRACLSKSLSVLGSHFTHL